MRQECIEYQYESNNRETKECPVPSLIDIAIVVQNNETLNLSGGEERTDSTTTLPTDCTKPPDEVR